MNKAIKYRIYPTSEQRVLFAKTFGCCRKVYNLMLSDKKASYVETGSFGCQTPAMYKDEYPYLREVDSLALANVQLNLQQAVKNYLNNKKHFGFPVYKSKKNSRKSYTTNNQNGTVCIVDGFIRLPKVGMVKAKIHRVPDPEWKLKSATISHDADDRYYASVLFEYEAPFVVVQLSVDNAIGLDYKSDGLYTDSNGHVGSNHKYYRESQKKLAKEQRRLSRKVGARKGETPSNNYLKQKKKVAKAHRHIANQRKDNLHKLSTEIANQYDIVCVETLDMKVMANSGFGNGKATLDNGYGAFLDMLEYKLSDRGKILVRVDKWFPSSQLCSRCGSLHPEMKDLKERLLRCDCGEPIDCDYNAARNILQEGRRMLLEVSKAS